VLVLPLQAQGVPPVVVERVTQALLAEAGRDRSREVKALRDVEAVLKQEERKQLLGCVSVACATDLAQAVEADQLVTGTLTPAEGTYLLGLSRVRARDAVGLARATETLPRDPEALSRAASRAATALFTDQRPPELDVTLRVLAHRQGSPVEEVLAPGATLQEGDRVAFEISVTPAAHVYLVQETKASGSITVLFPQPDIRVDNPLPAGTRVRIPTAPDYYQVDNQDLGTETVYVVASPRELPRLAEALGHLAGNAGLATSRLQAEEAMLAVVAGGQGPPCPRGGACPGRTRGLQLKSANRDPATARLRSAPGDDALFYRFEFEHVPAP
jgi:hypothetical protein